MKNRQAFTLLEVLISIALMGIVMVALFSSLEVLQDSNRHLLKYLKKAKQITKSTKVLYMDILNSDGNITIKTDEFSRLCIEQTKNSLYGLSIAKVCWVVLKEKNTLTRVEGNNYHLPLLSEEKVEADRVIPNLEIFDVYHQKDKVLVIIKQNKEEAITFLIQGISKPIKKKPKPIKPTKQKKNNTKKTTTSQVPKV